MAVFGNLADIPPKEVFAMLGRRSGKLHFQLPHQNSTEVHLHEGVLWSFQINGRSAHDSGTLEVGLNDLLKQSEGEFDFSDAPPEDLEHHIDITYGALLQIAARAEEDTAKGSSGSVNASQQIPDKDTRFTLTEVSYDLSPSLADFAETYRHLLEAGASAADIAEKQGMSLTRAQLYLSRLRSHGTVKPVRAYEASRTTHSPSPKPEATPRSGTEHRGTDKGAERSDTGRSPMFAAPKHIAKAAEHAVRPARRGLIRRLLAAIAPGGSQ